MLALSENIQSTTNKTLILRIGSHYFGGAIDTIQDVIRRSPTTPVPLTPDNIVGLLNLRGHIVTEIDIAKTLNIQTSNDNTTDQDGYSIVINKNGEMYSLVFDGIGDVVDVPTSGIEGLPFTVNKDWSDVSRGVYRMDDALLVILDFDLLIDRLTTD